MCAQVTCQSDVFSLGVTVFHCATGLYPFCDANAPDSTLRQLLTNDPKAAAKMQIHERGTDLTWHEGLSMIVAKALQKPTQQRYTSAADMLSDLEKFRRCGQKFAIDVFLCHKKFHFTKSNPLRSSIFIHLILQTDVVKW